ncbi:MAG: hypothetical protein ABI181_08510 [Mycobacteriaceae bacterium]
MRLSRYLLVEMGLSTACLLVAGSLAACSAGPAPPPPGKSSTPQTTSRESSSYVQPGSVGYRGDPAALTLLTKDRPLPHELGDCAWKDYGLRCDTKDLTLDRVHLQGGLYWTGAGTLTITDSVVEGGAAWYVVNAVSATPSTIRVEDSTLSWPRSIPYPQGYDVGVVNDGSGVGSTMLLHRVDISGMPQGIDPSGDGSVIDSCHIHDLLASGDIESGTNMHVDGIFSQGGDHITITNNYIDIPVKLNRWATASVFFQSTGPTKGHKVIGNYLGGGAYSYRNETARDVEVRDNTFSGTASFGDALVTAPATTAAWSGNRRIDGTQVPRP